MTGTSCPAAFFVVAVLANAQARLLRNRQRIELGAQHDGWSGAVLHDRDDAGLADAGRDVEAERLHARGELRRGLRLLESELGVLVQVLVERLDVRIDRVDLRRRGALQRVPPV